MKRRVFYNKVAVTIAVLAVVFSAVALSYLSYNYTISGENVVEATLVQNNIRLVEQSVARIEQKIIDNDRTLANLADVNAANWAKSVEAIRQADLGVDFIWFLQPGGLILYPPYDPAMRNEYGAVRTHFRNSELNLSELPLNEIRHMHKERRDNYFFASYVMKESAKGEKILVCFQMTLETSINLVRRYLQDLDPIQYVRIMDFDGNGVYGDLPSSSRYIVQKNFPTTFYKWVLQMVPRNFAELEQNARDRIRINFFFIVLSIFLIFFSLGIILVAGRRERQLVQLKENFISTVSHELKTPLSLIRMFSEILVMGKVRSEKTREEYYGIIHNESDRMSRLVGNLLDFARLERGPGRGYLEKTNVAQLVTQATEAYRYQIQKEGFKLLWEIDERVAEIPADSNALTMAFFNLLDNSIKYSGDQKEITVSVRQDNGFIELSVKDRGVGIPATEHQKIFEKFYRGESAAVQRIRGSGIGLSITKLVAEMHGGEVRVQSAPGEGSVFTLRLPVGASES